MLDAITAHVKLIHGNNILGEVVPDGIICAKLPDDGFFRSQEIGDLNIQLFSALIAYKVDLLFSNPANCDLIAPAQQLQIDDVLEDEVDVPRVAAKDGLPDSVVGDVVFLVGCEDLFPLKVLPLHLVEQVGVAAIFDIVQDGLRRNSALLVFEKPGKGGG